MKFRIGIFCFLVAVFAVVSPNTARACADSDADHAAKFHEKSKTKTCCSSIDAHDNVHGPDTADACDDSHPGQPCPPDDDGCGGCHCPGCGVVSTGGGGGLLTESPAILPVCYDTGFTDRQAFYFAEHIPEAVYLPIWQPPKI